MPRYYTPGIYFERADLGRRGISAIRTDVPGFVGITEKGPLDTPWRLESWEQFRSVFGGFTPQSYLAYAVRGFFENRGEACYVVRIADIASAKKAEAALLYKTGNPSLKIIALNEGQWGNQIKVSLKEVSMGSTLTENVYKCSACNYLYEDAKAPALFSDLPDTWRCPKCARGKGSFLEINQPADGTYSVVRNTTGFQRGSLVMLVQNQNGTPVCRLIKSVDYPNKKIVWDTPLNADTPAEANFDIARPICFYTVEFTLTISLGDRIKEVFKNLSTGKEHSRYAPTIVNEEEKSNIITLMDLNQSSSIPTPPEPAEMGRGFLYPENGADGINSIGTGDLTGVPLSEKKRGLRCYEDEDEVSMICIPDIMVQPVKEVAPQQKEPKPPLEVHDPCTKPEQEKPEEKLAPPYEPPVEIESPPNFTSEDIRIVQQTMIEHCEIMKDRVAILDAAFGADLQEVQEWRRNWDSKYAAFYYPWIRVDDPLRLDNQITRLIPPSGHIVGIYARSDLAKGVHKAPANEEVLGARDVAVRIESPEQEILNPMGINCLRVFPGRGVMVWGARTVSSDPSWRFVNVRRLLIMIEESVEAATQWSVFEPNNFHLRMGIRVSVSSFLEELWRKGALAGAVPEEAFFVKCDEDNNPQEVIDAGKVITEIGVAPSIPGEFIIFRIGKVADRIKLVEEI